MTLGALEVYIIINKRLGDIFVQMIASKLFNLSRTPLITTPLKF